MTEPSGPYDDAEILYSVEDAVATITLNRPGKLNTVTPAMGKRLMRVVDDVNTDDAVRVVVLTGTGERAFSAGSDVAALDGYGTNWQLRNRTDYARSIWAIRKPVIAKIRGYCIGGGLEMALMSDIRYGDTTSRYGAGEIKLGWHGGAGNTQLLPRLAGVGRAMEMVLTGDHIDATTAYQAGLIQRLLQPDDLDDAVKDLATRIANNPPIAVQLSKHLIRVAQSSSLDIGLAYENDTFTYCFTTEDAREGKAAFVEKRPPHYIGR
jgi:enoyl-CoA hydratase/carnithine racemase